MLDTLVPYRPQFGDMTFGVERSSANITRGTFLASYHGATSAVGFIMNAMFTLVVPAVSLDARPNAAQNKRILVTDSTLRYGLFANLEVADDGTIILIDSVTGIYGAGDEAHEAVADFIAALHDHAEILQGNIDLSAGLQDQLAYLQRHLVA